MSMEKAGRKKPFTNGQIAKLNCVRCPRPARFQWNACADGNTWRPLCEICDIEVNVMVLRYMGFKDWKAKVLAYAASIEVPRKAIAHLLK